MSRFKKAVCMGAFVGVLGAALLPLTVGLEESLGLDTLFRLRGPREVPPAVAVVTLDRMSAEELGVSPDPDEWPRSLHARLVDALVRKGARVIAFDIIFDTAAKAEDDAAFASAIRAAGNVVLGQGLTKSTFPLQDDRGLTRGNLNIETLIPPFAPFADAALATAPFPIPKVPVQVSQYWRIKPEAGDVATLPVVTFQVWALERWGDFVSLLRDAGFDAQGALPLSKEAVIEKDDLQGVIQTVRELFSRHRPSLPRLLSMLERGGGPGAAGNGVIQSLTHLYAGGKSSYLNYYGPPGSVTTVRYSDLVHPRVGVERAQPVPDLGGRAIFVGLSERMRPDQKDGFHTVYSLPSGVDLSGVEIAATAFANLVDDSAVRPVDPGLHFTLVCLWGGFLGFTCFLLPPAAAAAGSAAVAGAYAALAYHQFQSGALWLPLVLPLLILLPLAFFGALLWQYVEASREERNIRKAVGFFLPNHVVERLSQDTESIQAEGQTVYGTCLITDAEQYTRLSEQLAPEELSRFMNAYYGLIFEPVRQQGGIVSDVVGDSMLALWAAPSPDNSLGEKACRAALQIAAAVDTFNRTSEFSRLPTRIGMHSGPMVLGNIGAGDHYEYRPVGEVVNTASRIEGLNKFLSTRILVSQAVAEQINGFFTRELGDFLFVGKSNPVKIFELMGMAQEADTAQKSCCDLFAHALAAFREGRWERAKRLFERVLNFRQADGPSTFFLRLCEEYASRPPGGAWDGSITIDRK